MSRVSTMKAMDYSLIFDKEIKNKNPWTYYRELEQRLMSNPDEEVKVLLLIWLCKEYLVDGNKRYGVQLVDENFGTIEVEQDSLAFFHAKHIANQLRHRFKWNKPSEFLDSAKYLVERRLQMFDTE